MPEMNITLKSLEISNFKGIRHLVLSFSDGMNSLYGDNATGKTSVYDALTWLLFGKDSHGSTDFAVKPIAGIPGAMPEVRATLEVNGEPLMLRKTLREKWERHRGSAETRYAGDTRDYYIDDVPRKESEYKQIVGSYINEGDFKLLTSVYAFARDMKWKDRRDLLAQVCGLPSDAEILASAPQFDELAKAVGRRTVDEYKAALMAKRKGMNTTLNQLPVRIDECERMVQDLNELPFAEAQVRAVQLLDAQKQKQIEIAQLDGDTLLAQAEQSRKDCMLQLQELELQNNMHRASQNIPIQDDSVSLNLEYAQAVKKLEMQKDEAKELYFRIEAAENRLKAYRVKWHKIKEEVFTVENCPTCGQALPKEKQDAARAAWKEDKKQRQTRLLDDSTPLKKAIEDDKLRKVEIEMSLPELEKAARDAKAALDAYQPPEHPVIEDLPEYIVRKQKIITQATEYEKTILAIKTDKQAEKSRMMQEFEALQRQSRENDAILAKETQLNDARRRVTELLDEQKKQASELEQIEKHIAMCEAFARYRVETVTESVNSHFKLARFRLFTEQVNGALVDCCDVLVEGVPYSNLNSAMQICVGMDIIDTLSEHFGRRVPLFVDNAEGVTNLQAIRAQTIRLVVSENDKELRLA